MTEKTKIPEEIKKGLKRIADVTKKDIKVIGKELKEIIETDKACSMMESQEAKIRFGYSILVGRYSTSEGKLCYIMPCSTPRYRRTSKGKFVADLSCISIDIDVDPNTNEESSSGNMHYCYGTFWDEVAKEVGSLDRGEGYKCKLIKKENECGYSIYGRNPAFEKVDYKMPMSIKDFFEKEVIPNCEEVEMDSLDICESRNNTDLKIVHATVTSTKVDSNEKGEFAYYECVDMSIMGKSTVRFFVNPNDLIYGQSSTLYVVGTVDKTKDKDEYRFNVQFIINDIAIPIDLIPKAVDEDVVDISVDEEKDSEEAVENKEDDDEEDFGI